MADKLADALAELRERFAHGEDKTLQVALRASPDVERYSAALDELDQVERDITRMAILASEIRGLIWLARDAHEGKRGEVVALRPYVPSAGRVA